jgi:hypothetical protein
MDYSKKISPHDLSLQLRLKGPLSVRELRSLIKLSQPQISRYLKLLEPEVLKIGKGKNTKYVHIRSIPNAGDQLPVYQIQENGSLLHKGTLHPIQPKGFYWKDVCLGLERVYEDLPYFLNDLSPSGYLGRLIPRMYPEWKFPEDVRLWSADSTLRYLVNFGIDTIGNYIIGDTAAQKFLKQTIEDLKSDGKNNAIEAYELLAKQTESIGIPGSSAGGEHPKFLTRRPDDHIPVLVKFMKNTSSNVTKRRIDLLYAEHLASILFRDRHHGCRTRVLRGKEYTFLEVERFDRIGTFGRKGTISLYTLDAEFIGSGENWISVGQKLHKKKIIPKDTLREIAFREYFGHLIGNTDMHGGNITFYFEDERVQGIAPLYDMLPMKYAPVQEQLTGNQISISPPLPGDIEIWKESRELALKFWHLLQKEKNVSREFIDIASQNEKIVLGSLKFLTDKS